MDEQKLGLGQYDEAESHNSFLEALNAWRKSSKETKENEADVARAKEGKVKLNDVQKAWNLQTDEGKKGSFFANIDS